jgi:hypothetical protein
MLGAVLFVIVAIVFIIPAIGMHNRMQDDTDAEFVAVFGRQATENTNSMFWLFMLMALLFALAGGAFWLGAIL